MARKATKAQIKANRENAKKSTGPRTASRLAAEQYRENKTTKQSQYPEPYEESARYKPSPGPQGWTPTGGQGPHSRPPPQPPILPRPPAPIAAPAPPIVDDPQLTAYKKQNEPNSS